MRILLATGVYPPRIGGPSRQVYDLAIELKKSGNKVAVLTFSNQRAITEQDGIKVYYIKDKFRIFKLFRRYLGIKKMLKKIKNEFKPEVIQVNNVRFLAYWVGNFAQKNKIPAIIKYAGDFVYEKINAHSLVVANIEDVFRLNNKAKFLTYLEKKILNKFNLVWAQSQYQKEILEKFLKISPKKIIVMPNYIIIRKSEAGEDTKKIIPMELKRKIILSTSRFVPWKNVEAQLFVAKKLREISSHPFLLYIVGGSDRAVMERMTRIVRENNLVNEVKILPEVSPLEVERIFKQSDIYLSTSLYEPFGIVFIEAMASGMPIVSLGVCSIPEIIKDSHIGFVIKRGPNYFENMAERLKIILENDDIYKYFSENSLAEADKYNLAKNINKFEELYLKVING